MRTTRLRAPGETITTTVALVVIVAMLATAWGYGAPARTLPLVIGVPTAVLLVIHLLRLTVLTRAAPDDVPAEVVAAERIAGVAGDAEAPGVQAAVRREVEPTTVARELVALGWVVVLAVIVFTIGFLYGLPLFMLLYFRIQGRESWMLSLAVTAGVSAFLYLFLVQFVGLVPYAGPLGIGG